MSSGRGRGRLFEFLSQTTSSNQQSSSSGICSSETTGRAESHEHIPSEQRPSASSVPSDSGLSTNSGAAGRRQLHEQTYLQTAPPAPRGGQGRAKLLEAYSRNISLTRNFQQISLAGNESENSESTSNECRTSTSAISEDSSEPEVIQRVGTSGTPITVLTNFIRLKCKDDRGMYEYEVKFDPNIHSNHIRHSLLSKHRAILGAAKAFDGNVLQLPHKLPQQITELSCINEDDQTQINIKIKYKKKRKMGDCSPFYNVLLNRIMRVLEYVRFGRKQFDPSAPKIIPHHKITVWPGYVTSVQEFEGGLMLMLDVSHRLLCETTVYDLLQKVHMSTRQHPEQNFRDTVQKSLMHAVVLTRYNNKTYRVDDVDFTTSPNDTFKCEDRDITYVEYYKQHYNIDIKDTTQPMLVCLKERRVAGSNEKETRKFCILPELAHLTGMSDEQRKDFKLQRDIATFTRVTPMQRISALNAFCRKVNSTPEAKQILDEWGLELDPTPLEIQGRQLNPETIQFAKKNVSADVGGDFQKYSTSNELLEVINITNWLLLCPRECMSMGRNFMDCMARNSAPMGIEVVNPKLITLNDDNTNTYVKKLRQEITPDTQIVVMLCPTSRDDRYNAIKKVCCSEMPVPSQVINAQTLKNDSKNRAIVQKIALQMNVKLGGSLWSIKIPFTDVMICGVDTFHDPSNKINSVAAFVASININFTRWYSKATIQKNREELFHGLTVSMQAALLAFKKNNFTLPRRIIIFRDGVGDGQLKLCEEYEIPQIKSAFKLVDENYAPKITFIVVQKRVNARIFKMSGRNIENPEPGTIVDHTITRRYLYDFYLVSQKVRIGTVSPTHYIVVKDEANFQPDHLQRLSYKLCFLYYNWPGPVRVPACCQYAHKMAYLVGNSIRRETAEELADKLFYL